MIPSKLLAPLALAAFSIPALTAHATVLVQAQFSSTSRSAFSVSSTDLIQVGSASLASGPTITAGSFTPLNSNFTLDNINDGSASNTNGSIVDTTKDNTGVGSLMYEITFTFDTTLNTHGYDLSAFVSTANGQDERANQHIEILYRTVGSEDFTSLITHLYRQPLISVGGSTYSTQLTFTREGGGLLASGIDALRVRAYLPKSTIPDDPTDGATVFAEFDAIGTATIIPEPSSFAALAGLATLAACVARRRTRR